MPVLVPPSQTLAEVRSLHHEDSDHTSKNPHCKHDSSHQVKI